MRVQMLADFGNSALAGTHFSDFSKLTFYLFENVEILIFAVTNINENRGKLLISLNLVSANKSVLKVHFFLRF